MLRGPTFADMTGHIIIISKYLFCDNGEKMCQFCTLIFLLKLINFLKKDFPRRGPVFCRGGGGRPPGPRPSYASGIMCVSLPLGVIIHRDKFKVKSRLILRCHAINHEWMNVRWTDIKRPLNLSVFKRHSSNWVDVALLTSLSISPKVRLRAAICPVRFVFWRMKNTGEATIRHH